jgi:hypothetical protein
VPLGENGELDVLAPFNLGEVVGIVPPDEGRPYSNVQVFLSKASKPEERYRILNCDPTGHFVSRSIPPGEYIVGTIPVKFIGIPERDHLTKATVHANERVNVDLTSPSPTPAK